jgi:hypothetical protein
MLVAAFTEAETVGAQGFFPLVLDAPSAFAHGGIE